jgi:hypothetical protein
MQCRPSDVRRTDQVDLDDSAEDVRGDVFELPIRNDSGSVDHDIDALEVRHRRLD